MNFMKFFSDKKFIFLLLILDILGVLFSFNTYTNSINKHISIGKIYLIPFFMVSFWLYLFAAIFLASIIFKIKIPNFLKGLIFIYCFSYGFGSMIFYPLLMSFVKGFSYYHFWNVFAHGFVGLQSLIFLKHIKKPKNFSLITLILIFLAKDLLDLFLGAFLYFTRYEFSLLLKGFIVFITLSLQITAFYMLIKKN